MFYDIGFPRETFQFYNKLECLSVSVTSTLSLRSAGLEPTQVGFLNGTPTFWVGS
jgi:hypothetical protein